MPVASFEVGAIFRIEDQAAGILSRMGSQMTLLAEKSEVVKTTLESIGRVSFARMTQQLERLETVSSKSISAVISNVERLRVSLNEATASAVRLADTVGSIRGGGGFGGGGGRGGGGGSGGAGGMANDPGGWNAAARAAYPNAGWYDRNYNAVGASTRAEANYLNRDRDLAYDRSRREAEYMNREIDRQGLGGGPWRHDIPALPPNAQPFRNPQELSWGQGGQPPLVPVPAGGGGRGGAGGGAGGGGGRGGRSHGNELLLLDLGVGLLGAQSAKKELRIMQGLATLGYQPGTPEWNDAYKQLDEVAYQGHLGQIYSSTQVSEVIPGAAGVLGAVGGATAAERLALVTGVLPGAIRMGEVAQQEHLGELNASVLAGAQYAHMTRRYSGEGLQQGFDTLLNLSRVTHTTVPAEQSILKYGVPLGMAAGMKPDDAARAIGFFQLMGFSGSTAATGFGQMITGMTDTGGPLAAHVGARHHVGEFERSLGLKSGELRAGHKDSKHQAALQALGLVDAQGKWSADIAPDGNLDWNAVERHIVDYSKTHDRQTTLGTMRNFATVRGMRPMSILDEETLERGLQYLARIGEMPGAQATQDILKDNSTLQAFERLGANVMTLGTILTDSALGPAKPVLRGINEGLDGLNTFMRGHEGLSGTLGGGLVGAAIGTIIGGVLGFFVGGPGGTVAGATAGLAWGAGAGTAPGLLSAIARTPTITPDGTQYDPLTGTPIDPFGLMPTTRGASATAVEHMIGMRRDAAAGHAAAVASLGDTPTGDVAGGVNLNIGPINISGIIGDVTAYVAALMPELQKKITEALSRTLSTSSGPGGGWNPDAAIQGLN